MISLSENRVALINLKVTIAAINDLDRLIKEYSVDLPGPAYCIFNSSSIDFNVQLDRSIAVIALKAQRAKLADYLASLGIDANA